MKMDSVRILQLRRGVEELETRVSSLEQQVDNGDLLHHQVTPPPAPQAGDVAEMAARLTHVEQQLRQHSGHLTRVKLMVDANLARYGQTDPATLNEELGKPAHSKE